ncbi:hypothetical protein LJC58_05200 [Lachnospiraceae bacterium OttesenSCG-928-D06]|nr:hypothetical protein [Lachnospiraceae bacterium OttesenSCG-928-D06]
MNELKMIATVRRDKEHMQDENHFANIVGKLVTLGVNTFRINLAKFDVGDFDMIGRDIENVRKKVQERIDFILDVPIPGKKARVVTKNRGNINVRRGDELTLYSRGCCKFKEKYECELTIEEVGERVKNGDFMTYGDGTCSFRVTSVKSNNCIIVKAQENGIIEHGKALNFQKSLEFDLQYIEHLAPILDRTTPEYIALSFVENAEQVLYIKKKLPRFCGKIVPKIETGLGVSNINEIIGVSDVIMLGRGDLGLYVPVEDFAVSQEHVIEECIKCKREIWVATDVLNSMVENRLPVRSDIMDLYYIGRKGATGVVLTYGLVRSKQINQAIHIIQNQDRR